MPEPPIFQPGWRLQDGVPVTEDIYKIVADMLHVMNSGIDTLATLKA